MPIVKKLCLIACFMASHMTQASNVTLMVEDYPPYIQRYSSHPGFMTELVNDAFSRVDVKTEVKFASWYRVENAIESDRVLSFMWQVNKVRVKKWHFSDEIYLQRFSLIARADFNFDVQHLHSLRKFKIGLVDGIHYGEKVEGFRQKLNIQNYHSDFALLGGLIGGDVDLIAMDVAQAKYLLDSHYEKTRKKTDNRIVKFVTTKHFEAVPYYLVCSKNYGNCLQYIKKFNKGLAIIDADGSKQALIDNAEKL